MSANNPPAFPSVCMDDPEHPHSAPGMTLRDWFAGQALPRTLSAEYYTEGRSRIDGEAHERAAAMAAYRIADALLAARMNPASPETGEEA